MWIFLEPWSYRQLKCFCFLRWCFFPHDVSKQNDTCDIRYTVLKAKLILIKGLGNTDILTHPVYCMCVNNESNQQKWTRGTGIWKEKNTTV